MRSLQAHIQKTWPGVTHNKPLGVGYESRVGNDNNIIIIFITSQRYARHFARNVFCSVPSFSHTHSWKQCCSHFHFFHVRNINPQTPKGLVSLSLVTLCCQTPNKASSRYSAICQSTLPLRERMLIKLPELTSWALRTNTLNVSILLQKWTGRPRKLGQDIVTEQTPSSLYISQKSRSVKVAGIKSR